MKIQLRYLIVHTRRTTERIEFSDVVTFIHGPVGKGKSTVARLIDYCLGGDLERTPAIQQEFIAAILYLVLGNYNCTIERSADDTMGMRVTWSGPDNDMGSVNAPLHTQPTPLVDAEVYNFSDLVFYLCGVTPIKVRQRSRDHDSPLIRLSIRDIWRYCYLDQMHLDSSFFRFEDPFRGRKSQDAMRFFTGLHSERLSQMEASLMEAIDEQRTKRDAVQQIRTFMKQFSLGTEHDLTEQLLTIKQELIIVSAQREEIQQSRMVQIHPTDALREQIRYLSQTIFELQMALSDSAEVIAEQRALRAELITAKTKAIRAVQAGHILEGVQFERCPECGRIITAGHFENDNCRLCGKPSTDCISEPPLELEALRHDLNCRIDEIADSIQRREQVFERMNRQLEEARNKKRRLDKQLQEELAIYDSAFVESIRSTDREIATLEERFASLQRLLKMPQAINELEEQAGSIQGRIDRLRTDLVEERNRLTSADANIAAIADRFKQIMLSVGFPGVFEDDEVIIDPRNWKPIVIHKDQEWGFWDTGSGGKKTLFNVCYALAIHAVARERQMPLPAVLIIDSPTKNISEDENPELVRSLYAEIYRLATGDEGQLQFFLIDSDLVEPEFELSGFAARHMAGTPAAPSLIPYYFGP
jgi:DNA repair exonuclease SbcCD ATPase subunit